MKLQISFELLLYMAIAGIALLFGVVMLASKWPDISLSVDSLGFYSFINSLNEELSSGASSFSLYVPKGACNSTISGNKIQNTYGTYYLTSGISMQQGILCPDGRSANFTVSYVSGSWVIGR